MVGLPLSPSEPLPRCLHLRRIPQLRLVASSFVAALHCTIALVVRCPNTCFPYQTVSWCDDAVDFEVYITFNDIVHGLFVALRSNGQSMCIWTAGDRWTASVP